MYSCSLNHKKRLLLNNDAFIWFCFSITVYLPLDFLTFFTPCLLFLIFLCIYIYVLPTFSFLYLSSHLSSLCFHLTERWWLLLAACCCAINNWLSCFCRRFSFDETLSTSTLMSALRPNSLMCCWPSAFWALCPISKAELLRFCLLRLLFLTYCYPLVLWALLEALNCPVAPPLPADCKLVDKVPLLLPLLAGKELVLFDVPLLAGCCVELN